MEMPPEPPKSPVIAVIVPHYDDLRRLGVCLAALAPQLAAAGPAVEAVVVDNTSPVDLGALKTAYPGIRFVIEPTKGAAAARNRGVRETVAPNLAFLDCDCVPALDWLATVQRLAGTADVIGGRVDTFDETPAPRSGAEAFEAVFAFNQRAYVEKMGFSVTANLLTTRWVFEDVGELIIGLSEDVDWCRRAVAKGHALVYADDMRVSHPTRSDWPSLAKKWRRTTVEGFHLNGTSATARAKWALRALAVAGSWLVHMPKLIASDRLTSVTERARGAATLIRLRLARAGWMLGQAARGR